MAACKVHALIIFSALCFASTRSSILCIGEGSISCSIKLWNHSTSGYHLVKEYPCTPDLFGNNLQSFVWTKLQSFVWSKCPLSDINPSNACGPDAPAPFDNRSHVAVVLCRNKDCSIEEKANNLGQANYVAFITSDDHNCSGDFHLQTVSSSNMSSVPLLVAEEDGRELLSFANSPSYVVDINIHPDFKAVVLIILFISFFASCSCCCCAYTNCEKCLCSRVMRCVRNYHLWRCLRPAVLCVRLKQRRRALICTVIAGIVLFGICCFLGLYPWYKICLPPVWLLYVAVAVIGVCCICCWPCLLYSWCCRSPWNSFNTYNIGENRPVWRNTYNIREHQPAQRNIFYDDSDYDSDDDDDDDDDMPVRPSYRLDIDRLAVKCLYKVDEGMNETCAICLEEFTERELVRELPCLHVYHGGCIETWLNSYRHICPLCKGPITAKRKKRVAATKSEWTRLLAATDEEVRISYGASVSMGARRGRREGGSALFVRSI